MAFALTRGAHALCLHNERVSSPRPQRSSLATRVNLSSLGQSLPRRTFRPSRPHPTPGPLFICSALPPATTSTEPRAVEVDRIGSDNNNEGEARTRKHMFQYKSPAQAASILVFAGLCTFVNSDADPGLRVAVLSYLTWAFGEWGIHRYFMHAPLGSWADKVTHVNTLHVRHHADTNKDMTMKSGYDEDAIYFHLKTGMIEFLGGIALLAIPNFAFQLDIPVWYMLAASAVTTPLHSIVWNTLHSETHELRLEYDDGFPCLHDYPREASGIKAYVQWVFDNHTTHHDLGGRYNYNIVFPGPDLLLGTYAWRTKSVELPPQL